ncbi:MAG: endonuclease/exonuclease/phosphatase family protein [Rikenella sp.]|nr:endonuclease/exonuclease/phosphatase family protein [Rikenella sp.]
MTTNQFTRIFWTVLVWGGLLSSVSCGSSTTDKATADSSELRAMTFNIRYANPDDGPDYWDHRREAVVRMVREVRPDVMGIQEGLVQQVTYLDSALSSYSYVGVGRDDGREAGEYAAIFYNDSLYTATESGHFWLSETPDTAALGWDAVCIRIATWAKLREKATGRDFLVFNTHFDHIGVIARQESAKLLLDRVRTFGDSIPTLIMGDFNFPVSDPSLAPLVNAPTFCEARQAAKTKPQGDSLPEVTYRGFGHGETGELIDHIFCQGFEPQTYEIITSGYGVPYLSDHMPVVAVLRY